MFCRNVINRELKWVGQSTQFLSGANYHKFSFSSVQSKFIGNKPFAGLSKS